METKRPLRVTVDRFTWNRLKLEDPLRRRTAVCAFYNGYGMEKIRTLMTKSMYSEECVSLRSTAEFLGIDDSDDIVLEENRD